jgi:MFS family permease
LCTQIYFFTVGAIIVGRISDRVVIEWRKKRQGVWFPEDRLRASLIPFAITIPISVLAFGLINQFVDGKLGLGLSLVCLFFTGLGVGGHLTIVSED